MTAAFCTAPKDDRKHTKADFSTKPPGKKPMNIINQKPINIINQKPMNIINDNI